MAEDPSKNIRAERATSTTSIFIDPTLSDVTVNPGQIHPEEFQKNPPLSFIN